MFKNVQYYLRKYDVDKLTDAYFYKYCTSIETHYIKFRKITFGKYEKKLKKVIKDNIIYLRNLKINKVKFEDNHIFIAHKYMPFSVDDGKENYVFLYKIKDIIENKKSINSYAFDISTYSDMLAHLVADTFYNMEHIEDILVDFLHEATFFGYKEKHDINVEKEINILDERIKEIKENKTGKLIKYDYYEMLKKIFRYSDKKIKEIKKYDKDYDNSDAGKAEIKAKKKIIEYNRLVALYEIKNVRKDVMKYLKFI